MIYKGDSEMKKLLAVLLTLTLIFSFAACGGAKTEDASKNEEGTGMVGGWTRADSPVITDELAELFSKATEDLLGAEYEPVAYIAHQIVSGTNHLFLARSNMAVQDPSEHYVLVTIYENLEGKTEILDVVDTGVETNVNGMMGGWQLADSPEPTEEITEAFSSAAEKLLGVDYEPIAVLSRQVVSGTNYCILCESKVVAPDTEAEYCIAYLYVDLEGNSEITDVVNITADAEETAE